MEPSAAGIASEFQERRARTSRLVRPWIGSAAVGFGSVVLVFFTRFPASEYWRFWLFFGGFLVGIISLVGINLVVQAHYRCPACGGVVSESHGTLLDPDTCPRCGAALKY